MYSLSASFSKALPKTTPTQRVLALLCMVLLLNVIDAFATLFWVGANLATEANPLMNELLMMNSSMFLLGKGLLAGGGCALLWCFRDQPLAQKGAMFATSVYTLVCTYHLAAFVFFQV